MLKTAAKVNSKFGFFQKMKKMIIRIYEVQDPAEAENLIEVGVDHIGSVLLSREKWKIPLIRDTIATVQSASRKAV